MTKEEAIKELKACEESVCWRKGKTPAKSGKSNNLASWRSGCAMTKCLKVDLE